MSGQSLIVPLELRWLGDKPMVTMARIEAEALHRTFWEDCVRDARVEAIIALDSVTIDPQQPRICGQIFHMTRCGSTALLKQFAALEGLSVLSEPMIFVELLGRNTMDRELTRMRLRRLLSLFAVGLAPVATRIVVKWPTLLCRYASLIHEAIGDTPALFIHRDPVEVLASIEARPLGKVDSINPKWLSRPDGESSGTGDSQLARVAQLVTANCLWIAREPSIRTLDYACMPEAGWTRVAPFFGIELDDDQRASMARAARFDAKQPQRLFKGDGSAKQAQASAMARQLAAGTIAPALAEALSAMPSL
jgi:hypothetical protein